MKLFEYGGLIVEPGDDPEAVKAALADLKKGGAGSGNFGHSGRQGEVGGSGEGGGGGGSKESFYQSSRAFNERAAERERAVDAVTTDKPKEPSTYNGRAIDNSTAAERNNQNVAPSATQIEHSNNALRAGSAVKANGDLKAGLSKKNFEAAAAHIRNSVPAEHQLGTAQHTAARLARSNPLFNTQRFINAATGHVESKAERAAIRQQVRAAAGKQQGIPESGDPRSEWYYGKKGTGIADMIKTGIVKIRGAANGN